MDARDIDIEEQVEGARRELGYRRRVYPRRIDQGHMTQALADRQIAIMEAILATLEELAAKGRLL